MKNDRWSKETVILRTDMGSARDAKHLRNVWEDRLQDIGIDHYKIVSTRVEKGKGKKVD